MTGARARARVATIADIKAEASRQLAETGAAGLSLRGVARELGMVSSGIYRYFATRDELLTALIVDAYNELGDAADAAAIATRWSARRRWIETAVTVRNWGVAHPHKWALLYGSPVPGYAAPDTTVDPGTRVSRVLLRIVADAAGSGQLGNVEGPPVPRQLGRELGRLAELTDMPVALATVVRVLAAWSQLFGLVSFEVFGQTRGVVEDHAALLRVTADLMATTIGFTE